MTLELLTDVRLRHALGAAVLRALASGYDLPATVDQIRPLHPLWAGLTPHTASLAAKEWAEHLDKLLDKTTRRHVEVTRLDMLYQALQPGIEQGLISAITEARRISESKRLLLDLDAPPTPRVVRQPLVDPEPVNSAVADLISAVEAADLADPVTLNDGPL